MFSRASTVALSVASGIVIGRWNAAAGDGQENGRVMSYFSHTLISAEHNYSTAEREALVVISACPNHKAPVNTRLPFTDPNRSSATRVAAEDEKIKWQILVGECGSSISYLH